MNADAASRMTGYTASTNSYSGRLRWSVTKGGRAALISALYQMAGIEKSSDIKDSPSRIKRDSEDMKTIVKQIERSVNPFSLNVAGADEDPAPDTDFLVNISTGKSATDEITNCLLNIQTAGRERHKKFVEECGEDPERFEQRIERFKLITFKMQGAKNTRANNPIVKELKCSRDMLGRIALVATKREVDLQYVMTFPLTPVPLTMCKPDGTIAHTDKSALFPLLEKKVDDHGSPAVINAVFVDGNYQLRLLPPDIPPTFGGLSASILNSVLAYGAQRTDVVSDTLESGWIKECERERRGADAVRYTMSGPDQIRPKDLDKALKSPSFKEQLPQFLMRDWAEQYHAQALSGRELYLGVQGECARFTVVNGYVKKDIIEDLACNHPEADSRLCLHLHQYNRNNAVDGHNTVVRCSDTDILVILIHHIHRMKTNVWIETGTAGRGDRRYVDVTAIADSMGPKMCAALPAFHAYTGCDYTAAFIRKGKKRPFTLLEKDHQPQTAFEQLCTGPQSVA